MLNQKNPHIETLRGLVIICVVVGHVIGSDISGGMRVPDDSFLRYVYSLFDNLRMPIFTVISGWVYALRPARRGEVVSFFRKKVRRILLPLVCVGTLYFLTQLITPGTNTDTNLSDMWRIYIFPYTYYWYLPSLFLLFMLAMLLDITRSMDTIGKWGICLLAGAALSVTELAGAIPSDIPNLFSFRGALFLMPFFITGIGLNRFSDLLIRPKLTRWYLVGLLAGIAIQQFYYFAPEHVAFYENRQWVVPIGVVSSAYLVSLRFRNPFLIWMGRYAYTIYLFHGFGASGGRILLHKIGIYHQLPVFVVSLVLALFIPVIIEMVVGKMGTLPRMLFLGKGPATARNARGKLSLAEDEI